MELFEDFLSDCCYIRIGARVASNDFYLKYEEYRCARVTKPVSMSNTMFSKNVVKLHPEFETHRFNSANSFLHVCLREEYEKQFEPMTDEMARILEDEKKLPLNERYARETARKAAKHEKKKQEQLEAKRVRSREYYHTNADKINKNRKEKRMYERYLMRMMKRFMRVTHRQFIEIRSANIIVVVRNAHGAADWKRSMELTQANFDKYRSSLAAGYLAERNAIGKQIPLTEMNKAPDVDEIEKMTRNVKKFIHSFSRFHDKLSKDVTIVKIPTNLTFSTQKPVARTHLYSKYEYFYLESGVRSFEADFYNYIFTYPDPDLVDVTKMDEGDLGFYLDWLEKMIGRGGDLIELSMLNEDQEGELTTRIEVYEALFEQAKGLYKQLTGKDPNDIEVTVSEEEARDAEEDDRKAEQVVTVEEHRARVKAAAAEKAKPVREPLRPVIPLKYAVQD